MNPPPPPTPNRPVPEYGALALPIRVYLLQVVPLLQVLLAFPVTLFIYSVVLRIKLFGVLQAMAIFVILGSA